MFFNSFPLFFVRAEKNCYHILSHLYADKVISFLFLFLLSVWFILKNNENHILYFIIVFLKRIGNNIKKCYIKHKKKLMKLLTYKKMIVIFFHFYYESFSQLKFIKYKGRVTNFFKRKNSTIFDSWTND